MLRIQLLNYFWSLKRNEESDYPILFKPNKKKTLNCCTNQFD